MKIGILGAGITGLSAARFLNNDFVVEVLEKNSVCGGIARTRDVNGIAYHTVGGHCFNSKYPEIMDFVFSEVLHRDQWNDIKRVSKIRFGQQEYLYPIEFSVRDIYKDDPDLAFKITTDFLSTTDDGKYKNLADWFERKFGKTLAQRYFIPYNTKIWGRSPETMSPEWVQDKLPIPDKRSFFNALLSSQSDNMAHAHFYYPKSNNQNTFIDALATGVNVKFNFNVHSIKKVDKKWIVNDILEYDILINTTPIDILPRLIVNVPDPVRDAASLLRFNKISNVLWRTLPTEKTWTYLPEPCYKFHRYIHIGGYHRPVTPYSISESVGEHSFEDLIEGGKNDAFLLEPLAYNQSEHAYVVFDHNYHKAVPFILDYLSSIGLYSIGRFGEWQYYNMDVCMKRSLELAKKLING